MHPTPKPTAREGKVRERREIVGRCRKTREVGKRGVWVGRRRNEAGTFMHT